MSVPTIESIQGMMPKKDWETIDDDWAQHDMAQGAAAAINIHRDIAQRYGHIRTSPILCARRSLPTMRPSAPCMKSRNAEDVQGDHGHYHLDEPSGAAELCVAALPL